MKSLSKTMLSFVFLYNTAVLPSLPAQSETPSNLFNFYCSNKSCYFKTKALHNCKSYYLPAFGKADIVLPGCLHLQKTSKKNENCIHTMNIRVRKWFQTRIPGIVVFLYHSFWQTDSEIETCLPYREKDRHTFLAQINMDSLNRVNAVFKH